MASSSQTILDCPLGTLIRPVYVIHFIIHFISLIHTRPRSRSSTQLIIYLCVGINWQKWEIHWISVMIDALRIFRILRNSRFPFHIITIRRILSSKTEFLLIGTKQQRLKFSDLTNLSLSNDIIPVCSQSWLHIFDSDMSFSDQINSVSKSCHFHIRDIRRIRHLPLSTATALANSLVSSKLDYCNSLYSGISQTNLNKLQRI